MKKIFLFLVCVVMNLSSCKKTTQETIYPQDKNVIITSFEYLSKEEELKNFEKTAKNSSFLKNIKRNTSNYTESQTKELLMPLMMSSKRLLMAYDINIEDNFENENDTKIILAGFAILKIEDEIKYQRDNSSARLVASSAWDCAMDAIGVGAAIELLGMFGGATTASTTVILSAVGKLAKKYAGWLGTAIMVADFTECMDWW